MTRPARLVVVRDEIMPVHGRIRTFQVGQELDPNRESPDLIRSGLQHGWLAPGHRSDTREPTPLDRITTSLPAAPLTTGTDQDPTPAPVDAPASEPRKTKTRRSAKGAKAQRGE